ncbi:hypothetical protein M422DRAFT_271485, partial [Sphaerobolus stellatus SS14]
IVCFVGKGIWQIVEAAFKKKLLEGSLAGASVDIRKLEDDILKGEGGEEILPSTPTKRSPSKRPSKSPAKSPRKPKADGYGLQPYKFVYADVMKDDTVKTEPNDAGDHDVVEETKETLFFVSPSSSARVVSHQLQDKAKILAELGADLAKVKAKAMDTSQMAVIPIDSWMPLNGAT